MTNAPPVPPVPVRALLLLGVVTVAGVFAALLPERSAEADRYARAPPCAAGATTSSGCRLETDATVVARDCPLRTVSLRSCTMELRVAGERRFLRLAREVAERLTPGQRLRVEMFDGAPTAAVVDGRRVERYGRPAEAARTLTVVASLGGVVTLLLVAALAVRARR